MHRKAGGNPARECRKRGDDMPETWPGGRCSSPAGRSLQADPLGFLVEVQPHSHSKHLGKMAVMVRRTCVSKQVHTRRVRLARKENNMLRTARPAAAVEVKRRTYSRTDTFSCDLAIRNSSLSLEGEPLHCRPGTNLCGHTK